MNFDIDAIPRFFDDLNIIQHDCLLWFDVHLMGDKGQVSKAQVHQQGTGNTGACDWRGQPVELGVESAKMFSKLE